MGPKYCRTICLRPIQLHEWALGILEKGWGALRELWGGLGAVLRLCPCGVVWDPTSSLWSVIPQHRCQGTEVLVSSHWICLLGVFRDPKPLFSGVAGLDKSPSASMVPVLGSAWESSFLLTSLGKALFGGAGTPLQELIPGEQHPLNPAVTPKWGNGAALHHLRPGLLRGWETAGGKGRFQL